RIRLFLHETPGDVRASLNRALAVAGGDFIAFLNGDDVVAEQALYWVAKELIARPEADMIFSDEDRIAGNKRFNVHFNSAWTRAIRLSTDECGRLGGFRKSLIEKACGFCPGCDGSEDHDLVLRCARQTQSERIRHIPRVLYHRRATSSSAERDSEAASSAREAGRRAVEAHLAAVGTRATVTPAAPGCYQVGYELPSPAPRISILIATTGAPQLIEPCLQSISKLTIYDNFEILLLVSERHRNAPEKIDVWNRLAAVPRMRLLVHSDRPFNYSWVNNWGAGQASGDLLCFLND